MRNWFKAALRSFAALFAREDDFTDLLLADLGLKR